MQVDWTGVASSLQCGTRGQLIHRLLDRPAGVVLGDLLLDLQLRLCGHRCGTKEMMQLCPLQPTRHLFGRGKGFGSPMQHYRDDATLSTPPTHHLFG